MIAQIQVSIDGIKGCGLSSLRYAVRLQPLECWTILQKVGKATIQAARPFC